MAGAPDFVIGIHGGAQHPFPDSDDEPGAFGHRNELGGRNQPAVFAPPAQQGFDANHLIGAEIELRLIDEVEMVGIEGATQGLQQPAVTAGDGAQVAGIPGHLGLSLALGVFEGDPGILEQGTFGMSEVCFWVRIYICIRGLWAAGFPGEVDVHQPHGYRDGMFAAIEVEGVEKTGPANAREERWIPAPGC